MPPRNQVHVDAALTNLSVKYKNNELIAEKVLPTVPVSKDSDLYYEYGKENFDLVDDSRNPRDTAAEITRSYSTNPYLCSRHALRDFVDNDEAQNADTVLDPRGDATENVTDRLLLIKENAAASLLFNTTTFAGHTGALSGTTQWSYASSDPLKAIEDQRLIIQRNTGISPNKLIVGAEVFSALKRHASILDAIKYTQTGVLTAQLLAQLLDLEEVIIGKAAKNTAAKDVSKTFTPGFVWGKMALLGYVTPRPSLKSLSLGYTFESMSRRVKTYLESGKEGEWIEVEEKRDQRIIAAPAGYLWSAAVA